jgi:hypothetical protein
MKNPDSHYIAEVVSQGRSMTWGELLQCRMVRVGVSQCPTGGWPNHQGTQVFMFPEFCKRKTELRENGNFCLFAANGKEQRQISVVC